MLPRPDNSRADSMLLHHILLPLVWCVASLPHWLPQSGLGSAGQKAVGRTWDWVRRSGISSKPNPPLQPHVCQRHYDTTLH
ncbi:hypothetical protein F4861DRAFT_473558 [Xylaria intraflava]|nr:hypothetical protein F4861DRAFT_473558 [Xylaria intraflava]